MPGPLRGPRHPAAGSSMSGLSCR